MDLIEMLLVPEAALGTLLGLLGACLLHWLAPEPEPLLVEAMLVALGFVAGLAINRWRGRSERDR